MDLKTLIIDNYDSFTYNLFQYVGELGGNPVVVRNDEMGVGEILRGRFTHIVLSPGPGTPEVPADVGVSIEVLLKLGASVPILGVCLGHQAMIYAFGGTIVRAPKIMHGKTSQIEHDGQGIFQSITSPMTVMRYHSLVGVSDSIPECFRVTATCPLDGAVQAIRHLRFPMFGVQFHPESVGTPEGKRLLRNFLSIS